MCDTSKQTVHDFINENKLVTKLQNLNSGKVLKLMWFSITISTNNSLINCICKFY